MKLFYAPGACSLSPHIALREAGLKFDLEKVDLRAKTTSAGGNYRDINPKGAVPALALDNGDVLTEGAALVQYIADQKPSSGLAQPAGSMPRYHLQEWLNWIASEFHKSFTPLFNPNGTEETKAATRTALQPKLAHIAKALEGRNYLFGDNFTVADGYLYTILRWTGRTGVDIGPYPVLKTYMDRVAARPAVHAALEAEGLT